MLIFLIQYYKTFEILFVCLLASVRCEYLIDECIQDPFDHISFDRRFVYLGGHSYTNLMIMSVAVLFDCHHLTKIILFFVGLFAHITDIFACEFVCFVDHRICRHENREYRAMR